MLSELNHTRRRGHESDKEGRTRHRQEIRNSSTRASKANTPNNTRTFSKYLPPRADGDTTEPLELQSPVLAKNGLKYGLGRGAKAGASATATHLAERGTAGAVSRALAFNRDDRRVREQKDTKERVKVRQANASVETAPYDVTVDQDDTNTPNNRPLGLLSTFGMAHLGQQLSSLAIQTRGEARKNDILSRASRTINGADTSKTRSAALKIEELLNSTLDRPDTLVDGALLDTKRNRTGASRDDIDACVIQPPASVIRRREKLDNFSVGMPHLTARGAWLEPGALPLALRNAVNFLSGTPFPRTKFPSPKGSLAPAEEPKTSLVPSDVPGIPMNGRGFHRRLTVVLDLDETLMHCKSEPMNREADVTVRFEDSSNVGHVYFRPEVRSFLRKVSQLYELVIFTASTQSYADQVIGFLDPNREWVKNRLYRHHCTEVSGGYVKDLRIFNRPLDRVVLVDNSPISLAFQPDNGLLINSWLGDQDDRELDELENELQLLDDHGDVRRYLETRYGFKQWINGFRQNLEPIAQIN
ncbi:unnamed protein product [Vitrella brassicaformis CCMP3155]|uniref:FCP1 homology domain-containing protein n=1 Tax=Vitrella brassicaformis (strain CCMP3155) TaxID=1169540 RepID=A0A0G4FFU8_VITBC|nr:unnamed protein product [Vitrella brassicaformis CCMP3155]|mmetsp:Transcript_11902/g.28553  ORF Transcript_11902/g.28553 Transcript_11902/m.28553 type:complete len:529 (-) Transcript_11902:234-1820(-)|eukprot:CEM11928.1 unnamed protein product [Vitrella brassicaformis CCMP3155]